MSATLSKAPTRPTVSFPLGQVVMTRGVSELVGLGRVNPIALLHRHASGDWGEMDAEDIATNRRGVKHGGRLMSSYELAPNLKVWIITEWDRSVTTLLLPSEY